MVSSVRYPNFKKIGLPKKGVALAPLVVLIAVVVAVFFPEELSKMIFVPLVIYAAYGLKQNFDRLLGRSKQADEDEAEEAYHNR
ncbi:hypothetical protein D3C77_295810 [compost metagenome]